jgi:hypothetical protein
LVNGLSDMLGCPFGVQKCANTFAASAPATLRDVRDEVIDHRGVGDRRVARELTRETTVL